jgi:formylglycine-generating enzyme required for sulfatase activity
VAEDGCEGYEAWPSCAEVGARTPNQCRDDRLDHPANWIDWYRAVEFCTWRGGHLPTPEEWEKAARGPDGRTFPTGERLRCDQAHYERSEVYSACLGFGGLADESVPVDTYDAVPSPYGAINLAGNVNEWVDYRADREEPPPEDEYGLSKGGHWSDGIDAVQATARDSGLGPDRTSAHNGFRCALYLGAR